MEFAQSGYRELIKTTQDVSYEMFLNALNKLWEKFCNQIVILQLISFTRTWFFDLEYDTQCFSLFGQDLSGTEHVRIILVVDVF